MPDESLFILGCAEVFRPTAGRPERISTGTAIVAPPGSTQQPTTNDEGIRRQSFVNNKGITQ